MPDPRFIVAEVSKNWIGKYPDGMVPLSTESLCGRFEHIIEVNRSRGYKLFQFSLHRLMTSTDTLNETIIAVFELEEPRA